MISGIALGAETTEDPPMTSRFAVVAVAAVSLAGCEIRPTNPFDPATDAEFQQRATLTGSVRAVLAPDDDGTIPPPGACDAKDGDHSGFTIVLRGLADTGAGVAVESQLTNASGAFTFKDVPAGDYVVEVENAAFDVPAPIELSLSFGENRGLGVLCAIKSAAPSSPLVEAPPSLVDVDNQVAGTDVVAAVRIAPVAGTGFRLREIPEGGDVARDDVVEAGASVPLVLEDRHRACHTGLVPDTHRRAPGGRYIHRNTTQPTSSPTANSTLATPPP